MIPTEIPDPFKMKRALFIQPHPDDNELGAGATIAKLVTKGLDVHYLTVTDGSSGSYDSNLTNSEVGLIRRNEQENAGAILGVKKFHWLGFTDGHLFDCEELRERLAEAIRKIRPDIIFTVDPWLLFETHLDHIVTGKAASFAARICGNPRFYPKQIRGGLEPHRVKAIAYYTTNHPNTFVNVDEFWQQKLSAIKAHKSQFSGEYLQMITNYFSNKAEQLSVRTNKDCRFVEAFKILTPLLLHSNVDAVNM